MIKQLLPQARAWSATLGKTLTSFIEGLEGFAIDYKAYVDEVYLEQFPTSTRELGLWEAQFALPSIAGMSVADRVARLDAAWKASGGQDPRYIEDTLQAAGFDVYVHEWFDPTTIPAVNVKQCVTPRNPNTYLHSDLVTPYTVLCGEPLAQCGEAGALCGEASAPIGYTLFNIIISTAPDILSLCGEAVMECGEVDAGCGSYLEFKETRKQYVVPSDPAKWPYFLYIGGAVFGDQAVVLTSRKPEFEQLCLKICPTQQALGIMVTYT